MKKITALIACLAVLSPVLGRSKPVKGFTAFLLGSPHKDSLFTNQIPHGESAVYALAETRDGNVVGGTCVKRGKTPWLFYFDVNNKIIKTEYLHPLDKVIPGEKCITSLACGKDGNIYGATSNLTRIDYQYFADIRDLNYKGGHLFTVRPERTSFTIEDLGIPFVGEGIETMIAGKKGERIYGITVPGQIFFCLDVASGKVEKLADLPDLELQYNRYIGKSTKALVTDKKGNVYGSFFGGRIFKYDVKKGRLDSLDTELPTERHGASYDCISALTRTRKGRIFGGTFLDGKLFEFFPKTGKIKVLGMTSRSGHISGLAEKDKILYGITGTETSESRFFAYKIKTGEYKTYPQVQIYFHNTERTLKWLPNVLKNMVLLKNGQIVTGDNEDNGHVYTYEPQKTDWAR
jgi:hypothetical protein